MEQRNQRQAAERRGKPGIIADYALLPGVPDEILRPRGTWPDPDAYDATARELASMFAENFTSYADGVSAAVRAAGPSTGAKPPA